MFTDWRLPRELGLVTGLKEIDVNPDRFLSESDEELDLGDEDEADGRLAHWSATGDEIAVPRSIWHRSKETLRNWVWANRETVRKVTVYDQSEACLPLRYVRLVSNVADLELRLRPRPTRRSFNRSQILPRQPSPSYRRSRWRARLTSRTRPFLSRSHRRRIQKVRSIRISFRLSPTTGSCTSCPMYRFSRISRSATI